MAHQQFMHVLLLILQNYDQSVRAELHRCRQLLDRIVIQIAGLLNDQRTACNPGYGRCNVLLIEIRRINLRHLDHLAAAVLSDRLCKVHCKRRLSRAMCTENEDISRLGSTVTSLGFCLNDRICNLILQLRNLRKASKQTAQMLRNRQIVAVFIRCVIILILCVILFICRSIFCLIRPGIFVIAVICIRFLF